MTEADFRKKDKRLRGLYLAALGAPSLSAKAAAREINRRLQQHARRQEYNRLRAGILI